MRDNFSRPDKQTDGDTVLYELDMFRFASKRLLQGDWRDAKDGWVYLECFLIHFRNLIEFLGKAEKEVRKDSDIHISNIWKILGLPEPENLLEIRNPGENLWQKYERSEVRISQYLAHCTVYRKDHAIWRVGMMVKELEPIISTVERMLRNERQTWSKETPVYFPDESANSTATCRVIPAPLVPEF
jgi:hypothetical protein